MNETANANVAIAAILRGEVEQGFELYEQSLQGDYLPDAPAGLHIGMLEQAGRRDDAERLTRLAMRYGADLAPRAGSFLGADPHAAAAEYQSLFARGLINSRMVHKYLKLLTELGRLDEHARILAPELLFSSVPLGHELAEAVDSMLLDLEAEAERQDSVQSVRHMMMVKDLPALGRPPAAALVSKIAAHTSAYFDRWRGSDHPFASYVPDAFGVNAWGLISRGEGYNIPHIHAQGWATGVFYPRSLTGKGGELVVGRPKDAAGDDSDWAARRIKPEAGMLLLFPSFYTHWTVPLEKPGLRTSVAFDIVREG